MKSHLDEIKRLLELCDKDQRSELFRYLRNEFTIHPIETDLNTQAEVILEAISRSSDLTLRGIRGIIAEAAFAVNVLAGLDGWTDRTEPGDHSYDFLLSDDRGDVRVQVKLQRLKAQQPMMANQGYKFLPSDMYVVETQRTRGGIDPITGTDTRPYKFNEFDILAVSLHPSTNNWNHFLYTVADWLIPRDDNPACLLKFQPVSVTPSQYWTDDLRSCINWCRSGKQMNLRALISTHKKVSKRRPN